jgi:hypothetical protein
MYAYHIKRLFCFFWAVFLFFGGSGRPDASKSKKTGQSERRKSKSKSLWRVRLPLRRLRLNRPAAAAGERIPGAAGALELVCLAAEALSTQTPVKQFVM